ncbi:MAG: hypothetical protein R3F35_02520 [Myxococcota bacterium]
MSGLRRRAPPDNLDPLVDTLSNVVGILVIVIALTRLELGDAVARVAREIAAGPSTVAVETRPDPAPNPNAARDSDAALATLRSRLEARGVDDPARAERVLDAALRDLGPGAAASAAGAEGPRSERATLGARAGGRAGDALVRSVAEARASLGTAQAYRAERAAYAEALAQVPKRLVARLPDPEIVVGRESWILVRHGRIYPVDRAALFDRGIQAVRRIVPDGAQRRLRPDEFETVSRYLRKADIGLGSHHWLLQTEPALRMVLAWRTEDGGIDRTRLPTDARLHDWLARRDPAQDSILFHVWTDSFETYLEARTIVEAAGFRAGWRGHEADEELTLGLAFGEAEPDVRPIQVD